MSENRVALITGAGRGIGATIARTLAAEKTDIAVVDYSDESAAKETLDALKEAGLFRHKGDGRQDRQRFRQDRYSRQQCRHHGGQTHHAHGRSGLGQGAVH